MGNQCRTAGNICSIGSRDSNTLEIVTPPPSASKISPPVPKQLTASLNSEKKEKTSNKNINPEPAEPQKQNFPAPLAKMKTRFEPQGVQEEQEEQSHKSTPSVKQAQGTPGLSTSNKNIQQIKPEDPQSVNKDNPVKDIRPLRSLNGRIQDNENQMIEYRCEVQQEQGDEAILILAENNPPSSSPSPIVPDPSTASPVEDVGQNVQKKKIDVKWNNFIKIKKKNYADDYIVVEELGKGAFGTVSKVMLRTTSLIRAMKSIKKSSLIKEDEQKIFHEMAILQQMDHPNIIKLHQIYDYKNYYYLIMELCEGGELFDKIRLNKHFSERNAAEIMKNILRPVVYMHKQKIVHRDLKPENLLYSNKEPESTLKIIDFGTARKIIRNENLTKQIGTAYYIAPQVLNKCYNQKCDVWSCGVILYILLCGYPPFRGSTEKQILNNIRYAPLKFDGSIWKKISADAINLIKSMLDRDPVIRISALEALNAPWINSTSPDTPLEAETLRNLSNFHFKNRLKAVVMTYIASQLYSTQDKKELEEVFKRLDKDGDGVIERHELVAAYTDHYREAKNMDVNKILQLVDTNNSGKIDFTEFLVAASSEEKILNTNRLQNAFAYFDIDRSGYITIEEIKVFLNDSQDTTESIKEIFGQVDVNGDGTISKEEFIQLLLNNSHK